MRLIRLSDNLYPYQFKQLRIDNPRVSIPPGILDESTLTILGAAQVSMANEPTPGEGQRVVEGPPELVNGSWRQTWITEAAPVVVPERVETHKILIAMDAAGYLDQANSMITAANGAIKIAFDRAPYIHRNSPMVLGMADQMWPDDDAATKGAKLDALFIAAEAIET